MSIASAIGSIMAVVAVFERKAERNAVRPMKYRTSIFESPPTRPSIASASLRSMPHFIMERAMMNPPRNRNTSLLAYCDSAS